MTTFTESNIKGAWLINPIRHADERGWFQELFKNSTVLSATGLNFQPVQINVSSSAQGVVRGVHYSIAPEGQAKYVTVLDGIIDDYIVDVRVGSPTFGQWERVRLTAETGNSVLIGGNLGHAFQVISNRATVCYAVDAEFNSESEHGVNPECEALRILWNPRLPLLISPRDRGAKDLDRQNLLPQWPGISGIAE